MPVRKPAFQKGDRAQVWIEKLSIGGRGVARHEGLVIFVPDTGPEERVEIELTAVKKNFAEGRVLRILSSSPHRVQPPCPVAGICGGCSWQHVAYAEQLRQKREFVREALRKFSGFDLAGSDVKGDSLVGEVVPSPFEFRYRNRIQLHHAGGRLGFHRRGSHHIVDIDDCLIAESELTAEFPRLHRKFENSSPGRFELLKTEEGQVVERGWRTTDGDKDGKDGEDWTDGESLSGGLVEKGGGSAFSQVNSAQNERLVGYVVVDTILHHARSSAGIASGNDSTDECLEIYDLYAGNGNFTFPIAKALPKARITAVELNSRSVQSAREKVERDFVDRGLLQIEETDVARFLTSLRASRSARSSAFSETIVVLDPPRTGCAPDVMNSLVELAPRLIIYVSCHPVTLARDLSTLNESYALVDVRPFDMFPQTDHVETVAVLSRLK